MKSARALKQAAVASLMLILPLISCRAPSHQYVAGADDEFPRLRFVDGQVSLNDRCPVTLSKLNKKMDPVYVNGHPVGFC